MHPNHQKKMHTSEQLYISFLDVNHRIHTPSNSMVPSSPFVLYSNLLSHRQQKKNWVHCFWMWKKKNYETNSTIVHTPATYHPYPFRQCHSSQYCKWDYKKTKVKNDGNPIFLHSWFSKNEEIKVKWYLGQENLGEYASKNHDVKHHQQVKPIYLHESNSPRVLTRSTNPSALTVCVGTLPGGYICGCPLNIYTGTKTYVQQVRTLLDPAT